MSSKETIDWEQFAIPQEPAGIDWEQFAVQDSSPAEEAVLERFEALSPEEQKNTMEEILRWGAREVIKPAAQGVVGLIDIAPSLWNLAGLGVKAAGGPSLPQSPYVSDVVGQGMDALTQGYSEGEPGILGKGLEFASSVATGGGVASKLAKQAAKTGSKALVKTAKAAQFTGSTNPIAVTGAGVAGAATKGLEEMGVDPLSSLGGGLATGVATQAALTGLTKKPGLRAAGLGPKNLNTEALEAAERQGVDLPNFVASDAKTMGLTSQIGARTPVIGDKMQQNAAKAGEDFLASTKKLADKIGPELNEETRNKVKTLYERAKSFLNDKDVIQPKHLLQEITKIEPKHLLQKITKIEQEIGEKAIQSPKTKALVQDLEQLKKNLGVSQFEGLSFTPPMPVKNLVATKQELNALIDWDKNPDLPLKYYKDLRAAIVKDIEVYGKQNPQFMNAFNKANTFRLQIGNRETFDKKLTQKIGNEIDGVKYNQFIKWSEDPKNKAALEKAVGKENAPHMKDLLTIARAFKTASQNIPNPSGTAPTKALYKLFGTLGTAAGGILVGGGDMTTIATTLGSTLGGGTILNKILNDKKLLQAAKNYAQKPDVEQGKKLKNLLMTQTGLTATQLTKRIEQELKQGAPHEE